MKRFRFSGTISAFWRTYLKPNDHRTRVAVIVVATTLTAFSLVGLTYNFNFNPQQTILGYITDHAAFSAFAAVSIFLALYIIVTVAYNAIDRTAAEKRKQTGDLRFRDWLIPTGMLFIAWLPYLIACYPASSMGFDFFWQLLQGTGVFPLSQHHPVVASLAYGLLYRLGFAIGESPYSGLFIIVILQTILASASLGLCVATLKHFECPKIAWMVILVFFALCPIYPGYAVWLIKDSIFSSLACLLFVQFFWRIAYRGNGAEPPWFASLPMIALVAVAFAFWRNGTAPIVVVLFVILVVLEYRTKNMRRTMKSAIALGLSVAIIAGGGAIISSHAYPTNIREALCMPSRQIVNTIRLHPECLTEQDEELLLKAYAEFGDTLEAVVDNYNYRNADPIKPGFFDENLNVADYLTVWLRLGLRYPSAYLDAALQGSYGYWSTFFDVRSVYSPIPLYDPKNDFGLCSERTMDGPSDAAAKSLEQAGISTNMTYSEFLGSKDPTVAELLEVHSIFGDARSALVNFMAALVSTPLVSGLLLPGTYTYILIFSLGYLFAKRKTGMYLFPIVLILIMACISPVNAYMRYFLPVVMLTPFCLGTCFINEK